MQVQTWFTMRKKLPKRVDILILMPYLVLVLSHFLYMILDSRKTTRSQFSVPGLWDIQRNLKQEKDFNSRESFFRKSPFCTFFCINSGFGRPWGFSVTRFDYNGA